MAYRAWAAGTNDYYQLGLGHASITSIFEQVTSGSNWISLSLSLDSDRYAIGIKSDGTLWGVGGNAYNQLGLPTASTYTTITQVGSGTTWEKVAAGGYHSAAIKSDGTLWVCGRNNLGQLGIGNTTNQSSFVQVGSGTNWAYVACGVNQIFTIKTDGTLWAAGENYKGILGVGSAASYESTLAQVGSATNWATVSVFDDNVVARKTDGTVWAWGSNAVGQLGQGTTDSADHNAPLQIGSATNWTDIRPGFQNFIALNSAGETYVCGYNTGYELGRGNNTTVTTPTLLTGLSFTPVEIVHGKNGAFLLETLTSAETISLPITIIVGERGTISTPITIEVRDTGTIRAPLTIRVTETGTVSMPITINVYDPAIFSQTAVLPKPAGVVPAWSVKVMLDGEDVSPSLYGTVTVDAEEDASRVATFFLALSGSFNPTSKNRKPVTIDYQLSGTAWRIFTGRVDATVVDLQNRAIRFDCADLRADLLDGASAEQSNALTPTAYHSRILYKKASTGRDYLRQRMVSYAGNLDLDAIGKLRVVAWSEGGVVKTFTAADVFDGSVSVNVSQASGAGEGRNQVIIESRTQRLRSARMTVAWLANEVEFYQPTREVITDALESLEEGWQVESSLISIDQGTTPETAIAASATLVNRWVQDVTTTTTYILRAAGVEADAPIVRSNRVGIETKYVESAWVDDERIEQDTEPGSDLEEEQQNAIRAALNATRKDILAAHRAHRVEFEIPLDPTIDLHNVYRLNTDSIDAAGQCARVQHILDLDKGEVTSRISLALYGAAAAAPDVADDSPLEPGYGSSSDVSVPITIAPPAMINQIVIQPLAGGLASPDWDLSGWACEVHTYVSGTERSDMLETDWWYGRLRDVSGKIINYRETATIAYDIAKSQFRIDVQEIDAELTNEEVIEVEENQIIAVPASRFTITF